MPSSVKPSVLQSQPPCADGQTATMFEASVLVASESQIITPSQSWRCPRSVEGSSLGKYQEYIKAFLPPEVPLLTVDCKGRPLVNMFRAYWMANFKRNSPYICPVLELHPPLELPDGLRPALHHRSIRYGSLTKTVSSPTHFVFPLTSTAGKGTQPLTTFSLGW